MLLSSYSRANPGETFYEAIIFDKIHFGKSRQELAKFWEGIGVDFSMRHTSNPPYPPSFPESSLNLFKGPVFLRVGVEVNLI
jgi:hypothetical protein